jgi:hypothetical protein
MAGFSQKAAGRHPKGPRFENLFGHEFCSTGAASDEMDFWEWASRICGNNAEGLVVGIHKENG